MYWKMKIRQRNQLYIFTTTLMKGRIALSLSLPTSSSLVSFLKERKKIFSSSHRSIKKKKEAMKIFRLI